MVGAILEILFILATIVGGFILHPILGIIVLLFWAMIQWREYKKWD